MIIQKSSKVLLFAILIISFFGMNLEEGKAACPPGWYPMSKTYTYNGCDITVNFCLFISPMGLHQVKFDSFVIPVIDCPNGPNITDPAFWNFTNDVIIDYLRTGGLFPIPLCSENTVVMITVERNLCWKYVQTGGGGLVPIVYSIVQCEDSGTCEVRNVLCYDLTLPPPYLRNTKTYTTTGGESSCETWTYNPNANPWELPIFDVCFHTCY